MNFLHKSIFLLFFVCFSVYSCSQSVPKANAATARNTKATSNFIFDVSQRPGGTAFYSMDNQTGAMSYMLDYGENAGQWSNYGNLLREEGGNPLLLNVVEGIKGTFIYALDSGTGQVYYMLDHGNNPGQWMKFGGMIRQNALNMLQFKMLDRGNGDSTFYAYDNLSHNTYFMNLAGPNAGNWAKYGTPYQAE